MKKHFSKLLTLLTFVSYFFVNYALQKILVILMLAALNVNLINFWNKVNFRDREWEWSMIEMAEITDLILNVFSKHLVVC